MCKFAEAQNEVLQCEATHTSCFMICRSQEVCECLECRHLPLVSFHKDSRLWSMGQVEAILINWHVASCFIPNLCLLLSSTERLPGWNPGSTPTTLGWSASANDSKCIFREPKVRDGQRVPKMSHFSGSTGSQPWNTECTWWTSAGSH